MKLNPKSPTLNMYTDTVPLPIRTPRPQFPSCDMFVPQPTVWATHTQSTMYKAGL